MIIKTTEKSAVEHETSTKNFTSHKESGSTNDAIGHDSSKQIPNDLDYSNIDGWPKHMLSLTDILEKILPHPNK